MKFITGEQIEPGIKQYKKVITAARPLSNPPRDTTSHKSGGGGADPRFTMYMYLCIGVFGKSAQKILVEENELQFNVR